MQITVNGDRINSDCATLDALITQLNYDSASVATAVDGVFVAGANRQQLKLEEGMNIDVVAPMQGG